MSYFQKLNGKDVFSIKTLYIKALAGKDQVQKLQRDDILNHFIEFGDVTSVRLRNKPKRSYGFVKFTHPESAAKALQIKIHKIAGLELEIDVAHPRYQDRVSLLDLNNDCLFGIVSATCLSIEDLCSVAETSRLLKQIAVDVFRRRHKKCKLLIPQTTECSRMFGLDDVPSHSSVAKRILIKFGSLITELDIDGYEIKNDRMRTYLLDFVSRYCIDSLRSLTLRYFNITYELKPMLKKLIKIMLHGCSLKEASTELFAECHLVVELTIYDTEADVMTSITENTFPKLMQFKYVSGHVQLNESFLSRHKNLQVLLIVGFFDGARLLQSIADNCRQLEQLRFDMPEDTFDLSKFISLKKLKVDFVEQHVTKAKGWNKLNNLVELELEDAVIDTEFVGALSQLKGLKLMKLWNVGGIQNLQQIGDMNQLIELTIFENHEYQEYFDSVRLIRCFGNLKYLTVNLTSWEWMNTETYLQIVDIVKTRPVKYKLHFQLYHERFGKEENDVFYQNRHLVEMNVVERF